MYLGAGQATGVSSIGGSVDLAAGGSASKGGDVLVSSGSGAVTSGKIGIESNAAMAGSTSGDVLISSGLSSGGESGAGKCCIQSIISVLPILNVDHHVQRVHFPSVVISTGNTSASRAGILYLKGGASRQGQGGNVDILGGQSIDAGIGGSLTLGT